MFDSPHRRFNPFTGEWVLVSPHRAKRPWLGQVEKKPVENLPSYDPGCYLCPRNERAGGLRNPDYSSTFVFDNDFAALLPDEVPASGSDHPLLAGVPERGLCRVVCFSPRHDLTLPELELPAIENVIQAWTGQSVDMGAKDFIQYVQVFENKGAMMGCSNPHPHSQIWACDHLPREASLEDAHQRDYHARHGRPMLLDVAEREAALGERVVVETASWLAVVPHWAAW